PAPPGLLDQSAPRPVPALHPPPGPGRGDPLLHRGGDLATAEPGRPPEPRACPGTQGGAGRGPGRIPQGPGAGASSRPGVRGAGRGAASQRLPGPGPEGGAGGPPARAGRARCPPRPCRGPGETGTDGRGRSLLPRSPPAPTEGGPGPQPPRRAPPKEGPS